MSGAIGLAPSVLHLGDCLDPVTGLASLADRSVDHVICDPPYSEKVHADSMSGNAGMRASGQVGRRTDLGFVHITQAQRVDVARQIARIVSRWVLIFCDVESAHLWREELIAAGMEGVRTGAWRKVGGTPQFTGDRPGIGFEAIVIAHRPGRKRWNGGGRPGIWECPIASGADRIHTTQKPIDLMLALVRDFTDPGDLILDPFAGSGTTGTAALQTGRRFIGWERDAKYHALASSRLAQTREQPSLFGAKPKRAKTADLFAPHPHDNSTTDGGVNT